MNKNVMLAMLVWATDCDLLNSTLEMCLTLFLDDARKCYATFTDPADEDIYVPSLLNIPPVDMFADYVLRFAKSNVTSGFRSYGIYDKMLLAYK